MKNHRRHSFLAFFAAALCAVALTSCDSIIGYGIVLWNVPEYKIEDGTILPVYVKSNISKQYVVGLPGSKEKVEIPLWKMTEPYKNKRKAMAKLPAYEEYLHQYAICTYDGLPIREETVNTSKQVYRLRKGEVIRVLYSKDGQAVTTGDQVIDGIWLRVITNGGTSGWCFSHYLSLFAMNADGSYGAGSELAETVEADENLEMALNTRWYPDYYSNMIKNNQIDIEYMKTSYGLDTGTSTGVIALHMPGIDAEYPFNGVTKVSGSTYKFNDTSIQFTIRNTSMISVQYVDVDGMPTTYSMISLPDSNIGELINSERKNRANLYSAILTTGPVFTSSNYGTLTFKTGNAFTWTGYDLLVPSVVSRNAGNSGSVNIKYFLPKSFANSWDGILTFKFTGMTKEVNFLYKRETNGLRISNVNVTVNQNNRTQLPVINIAQPSNAVVIFLQN